MSGGVVERSAPGGHHQFGANVQCNLVGIVVNEVPDLVVGNSP